MTTFRSKPKLSLRTSAAIELLWRNGYDRQQIQDILVLSPWSVKFHLQEMGYLPRMTKGRVPLAEPRPRGRKPAMPPELRILARHARPSP